MFLRLQLCLICKLLPPLASSQGYHSKRFEAGNNEHFQNNKLVRSLAVPKQWTLAVDGQGAMALSAGSKQHQMLASDVGSVAFAGLRQRIATRGNSSHSLTPALHQAVDLASAVDRWQWRIIGCSVLTVSISFMVMSSGLQSKNENIQVSSLLETFKFLEQGRRTLGFTVLWTLLGLTAAGFAPAYILKFLGRPWYFDTARQLGAHTRPGWVTLHGLFGALWVALPLHQTITAFRGVARQSSHRMVGYAGAFVALLCSVTGIHILFFGAVVSRFIERQPVTLCGIYTSANVLLGVIQVRQKQIEAHKQSMAWAIAWTAWPGMMRVFNFVGFFFYGRSCRTQCLNLQFPHVPDFCNLISFMQTECGMGYFIPEVAWLISWGTGCIMWLLWGCHHIEIMAGNSMGFMLAWASGYLAQDAAKELIQGHNWITCAKCQ